jgi:lipopolysaccharide/colanic/teichoic acid biosynthesis glycosyltransferase
MGIRKGAGSGVTSINPNTVCSAPRASRNIGLLRLPMSDVQRKIEQRSFYALTPLSARPHPRIVANRRKRALDISVALLVVLTMAPLFGFIALAILLESGPPVLFRQKRHGLNCEVFTILKFRSMTAGADVERQAAPDDSRVTVVGWFLRRSSLDELPQILNVLFGQMSLVGPRPHPVWLDQKYGPLIGNYHERYVVKPGITGLAQINGLRGEIPSVEDIAMRVAVDLWYIEQWSLALDLKVLLLTAIVFWRDKRAY